MKSLSCCLLFCGLLLTQARAVETMVSGSASFNSNAPTGADIPNWNTGWGAGGITGWNYVGSVNGASGVYLGNNWVITAGHVGAGTFTLDGTAYAVVPGSAQGFLNNDGTVADLTLFKLTLAPNLPALTIASSNNPFSQTNPGDPVVMIGYGGGRTWGLDVVTNTDLSVPIAGFMSTDFATAFGFTAGTSGIVNNAFLVGGDSGGGDFIYNTSTQTWMLSGLNEAIDPGNNSYMVQLDNAPYTSQINNTTVVPEPSSFGLLGLGIFALFMKFRWPPISRHRLPSISRYGHK